MTDRTHHDELHDLDVPGTQAEAVIGGSTILQNTMVSGFRARPDKDHGGAHAMWDVASNPKG